MLLSLIIVDASFTILENKYNTIIFYICNFNILHSTLHYIDHISRHCRYHIIVTYLFQNYIEDILGAIALEIISSPGGNAMLSRMDSKFPAIWNRGFTKVVSNGKFKEACEKAAKEHGLYFQHLLLEIYMLFIIYFKLFKYEPFVLFVGG